MLGGVDDSSEPRGAEILDGAEASSSSGRGGRSARGRRPLRRLGRAAALIVVPLLLLEVVVRLASPLPAVEAYLRHPDVVADYGDAQSLEELLDMSILGFRPLTKRADFVLNSRSLKTLEYSTEKPAGTLRILAIGDSFTFSCGGVPHESLWHRRLADALRPLTEFDVEVLSLGVPATDTEFALRMWELEGSRLDADLVVFGFPVASNFNSAVKAQSPPTFKGTLLAWSYGYRLVDNLLRLWSTPAEATRGRFKDGPAPSPMDVGGVPAREVLPDFEHPYDDAPELTEARFLGLQRRYLKTCSGVNLDGAFPSIADALRRLARGVEASGGEFLLMVIPAELQVTPDLQKRVAEKWGVGTPTGGVTVPQELLDSLREQGGIRILDLLPAFRNAPSDERLYKLHGTHWNIAGNAMAGQQLAEFLTTPDEPGGTSLWQRMLP
jgi:hypothetical protein